MVVVCATENFSKQWESFNAENVHIKVTIRNSTSNNLSVALLIREFSISIQNYALKVVWPEIVPGNNLWLRKTFDYIYYP